MRIQTIRLENWLKKSLTGETLFCSGSWLGPYSSRRFLTSRALSPSVRSVRNSAAISARQSSTTFGDSFLSSLFPFHPPIAFPDDVNRRKDDQGQDHRRGQPSHDRRGDPLHHVRPGPRAPHDRDEAENIGRHRHQDRPDPGRRPFPDGVIKVPPGKSFSAPFSAAHKPRRDTSA